MYSKYIRYMYTYYHTKSHYRHKHINRFMYTHTYICVHIFSYITDDMCTHIVCVHIFYVYTYFMCTHIITQNHITDTNI